MKVRVLLLNTDYVGEFLWGDQIGDSVFVMINKDGYEFKTKDATPIQFKAGKFKGFLPLYVCSVTSCYPISWQFKSEVKDGKEVESSVFQVKEKIKEIKPADLTFYKSKINPSLLYETGDLRFLKSMKRYASGGGDQQMMMKMLFIGGIIIMGYFIAKYLKMI